MWSLIQTVPNWSLRGGQRPADVAGPDRRYEPIADVVRPGDRLVVAREPLHGDDRAEHLALDDLGVLTDIDDYGRLEEEAAVAVRSAAGEDRRLRLLRALEKAEHPLLLRLRDHRPHLDLGLGELGISGKFHGAIPPTIPSGSRRIIDV